MKKIILILIAGVCLQSAEIDTLWVNTIESKIEWVGRKITGEHNGNLSIAGGFLEIRNDSLIGGEILVNMQSITVLDIESPKWNKKLVDHLKSSDFFNTTEFPTARIEIIHSSPIPKKESKNPVKVSGKLDIKGIVNPININTFAVVNDSIRFAKGTLEIDRTKWNIRYGSTSFFDDLGDKAILDIFLLNYSLSIYK